ncbi:hypothetical protein [Algirhabdus cladophorae]|uniref:hypothetical protein n=1 Tax=Algirhabdus cladophorae TaxID=3377108 RepID=UPI003B848B48
MKTTDSFEPFSAAETKLLETCSIPDRTTLGNGEKPNEAQDDNSIRADLIRHLLLETDPKHPLHPKGMRLRGAYIQGALDLQGCDLSHDISLSYCHLSDEINLVNTQLRGLHISACALHGMAADNSRFNGSFYLRNESHSAGEISLAGATVEGDLQLCGAVIIAKGQDAVFAPSLEVQGSVFLGNYPYGDGITSLRCEGQVFLSSARIAHDFFVTNTAIMTNSEILGAPVFGATEEHGRDIALSLARARVGGILFFQDNQITRGIVNLAGANVARLRDEPAGPGANYPIRLDGFRYNDFSRHTDTSLATRLEWLERKPEDMPFTAQPYEHLADVLRSLGHRTDATGVLIRKEMLLRAENRRLIESSGGTWLTRGLRAVADGFLRITVGYGYKPGRAVVIALVLITGLGLFFDKTWHAGDMTPNAAPILTSAPWIAATQSHPENPSAFWASVGQAGQDYETFNGFAYAADLVIPLVTLGQENAWAPSTSRSPLGRVGWWLRWIAMGLGWVVTALLAAAITGVIRQE